MILFQKNVYKNSQYTIECFTKEMEKIKNDPACSGTMYWRAIIYYFKFGLHERVSPEVIPDIAKCKGSPCKLQRADHRREFDSLNDGICDNFKKYRLTLLKKKFFRIHDFDHIPNG